MPQPDGATTREHIESARKQGATAEEIAALGYEEPPPPPPEIWRVLPIWYQLCGSRSYVEGVPLRVRDSEIVAWSQLRGEPLSPHEMRLFDAIETVWLDVMRTKGAPKA